ncbi:MAG TPA: xanthine dehydrogenase family protein molybdopterin-binding subunit [Bacillota bacterium]
MSGHSASGHSAGAEVVGRSVLRIDALEKVTGQAKYPGDFAMPGMRHAKVVWAGEPHAKIAGIDTAAAAALPGVVAVLTSRDVPHNEYGLIDSDQQVLADGLVRWTGEAVAVVVADTEDLAAEAAGLVRVTYEPLPLVLDPIKAMAPDAPVLHSRLGTNVLGRWKIRHGDADRALAEADLVIESEYRVPLVEHAYLQPEAGLGWIDEEGRVALVVAGQWPHDDVRQIAHALGLRRNQVREVVPYMGGAFGGREDVSLQIIVALAAWKTRGPVKMVWTREESVRCHGKRHAMIMRYRWGAKGGRLTAAKIEVIADAGAYSSSSKAVVPGALSVATGPYDIPNVSVDACVVHTNNPPTMAMRGFGTAQPPVAYEQHIDKFARALGEDPISFRLRHLWDEGSIQPTGGPVPPAVAVKETLRRAALAAGWKSVGGSWVKPELPAMADGRRRGVGVATAFKNIGYSFGFKDRSTARVLLTVDEKGHPVSAELFTAATEVGMGVHTVLVQIAAQELKLPIEAIKYNTVDTSLTPDAGSASASRHTYISGKAVQEACRQAEFKRENLVRDYSGQVAPEARVVEAEFTFNTQDVRPTSDLDPETGAGNPHISYGYITQIVEVAVDQATGSVAVERVFTAVDVGKVMNPLMVEGQVGGGLIMGLGYAVMEEFKLRDNGRVWTRNFSEYLIPTVLDMPPELTTVNVERPDPVGPYGAKGIGEHVMLPTAPAVANAIRDAVGADLDQLPAGPERVWRALNGQGGSK